jgi:uncharacterized protein (DUF1015 family)
MAEIHPFRALHYNPSRIQDLSEVVTQPYDKISPEMQSRYYRSSPFNLVRVIRGRPRADDNPQDNVYVRAVRHFRQWIEDRILVSEAQPAIYPYDQEYEVPGQPGSKKVRRGFIAICRLEDYSARIVHRHEETLSAPKVDRLELLKATRAHFGQIFMLYSDPTGLVESLLAEQARQKPWEQLTDEYKTLHSVWRITEPQAIERVVAAMADKKLVIADGHHRYETALAYRDYCRIQGISDNRAEYVMMTFIAMEADGLTILPTHRLVHSLPAFDWARFLSQARSILDVEDFLVQGEVSEWAKRFVESLARAGRERPTFGAYAGPGKLALLRLRSDFDLDRALHDLPQTLCQLDVILLHRLVLEQLLGIDRQAVREEKNLAYYRDFPAAAGEVANGKATLCLLLNPTPVEAVRDNAFAGLALPQKSTDFYPKLLSGLTIYWLDNPAELCQGSQQEP